MSKKWILWAGVPLLLLASPWPAWLWWKHQGGREVGWSGFRVEAEVPQLGAEVLAASGGERRVGQDLEDPVAESPEHMALTGRNQDEVFVAGLHAGGGLRERVERVCGWADVEERRQLEEDWVHALSLLRLQHRLAKEGGGMEFAFIGAPGDLLFSLMPDLGEEIDAGRVILRTPDEPELDASFGSPTARFRLEPEQKTLVVEVRTRFGYFDLELGRDCGEPDLHQALWAQSGVLWRKLLK
jgi:hypothetical protein